MTIVRRLRAVGVALVASLAAAGPLSAQAAGTGTITGRVIDRSSQQPVPGANVRIVGTQRGTQTQDNGTFRLAGVPAGQVQVQAQRIGYQAQTVTVSVQANGTATVDFALAAAAVQLEQVVISGTGEQERRRERGASVAVIDSSLLNQAATPNLSAMLQGRTAGVTVQQQGGTAGTSSRIRIRGSNSLSLSNEPLLIVDGVVLNNSTSTFGIGVGGQTTSRFNDINNEDIENIEVIKGPAATALFGTAAANGVIQITTKRGRPGTARWNTYAELGSSRDVIDYPANYSAIGVNNNAARSRRVGCTIDLEVRGFCFANLDSLAAHSPLEVASPFRTGARYTYGLNASGGADVATYYLGAELQREQGIFEPNKVRNVNLRSNVTAQLRPTLNVQANIGYILGQVRLPYNDNTAFGVVSQGLLGKAFDCRPDTFRNIPSCGTDSTSRGYFSANAPPEAFYAVTNQQEFTRFIGGLTTNWQPTGWLRGVARAGVDLLNREDEQLFPPNRVFYNQSTREGSRFQQRAENPTYSANATLTGTFNLLSQLVSNTSVGAQYQNEVFRSTSASGAILLPGTASLGGTSARFSVGETNSEVITIGGYVEQRLAWADRLFLTGALRADDNSAFGQGADLVYYPAASVSWVLSEEGFFPRTSWLDQLRLRAAYGRSGQRPGFRQADTFFDPVSVRVGGADVPAITIGGTGNTELRPEISSEVEAGFETGLLGGRVGLEFNLFNRVTRDALVSRPLAPSLGVSASQFANLARVTNRGTEALVNATVFNTRPAKLDATVTYTRVKNKVEDLGLDLNGNPITPILFGFSSSQRHQAGLPAGAYYARTIASYEDLNNDGLITRVNCPGQPTVAAGPACEITLSDSAEFIGTPLPTQEMNFNVSLTVFQNVRLQALVNRRSGQKLFNSTEEFRCGIFQNCRAMHDRTTPLAEQAKAQARLMGTVGGYIEDADFTRLSELSLTVDLPTNLVQRFGRFRGASLTFAGRNLALWTDYAGFDPEVNSNAAFNFTTADFLAQPPVRQFNARLNLNF